MAVEFTRSEAALGLLRSSVERCARLKESFKHEL